MDISVTCCKSILPLDDQVMLCGVDSFTLSIGLIIDQ